MPAMQRFMSNLLIVFGCIAFAVVGLGPRGGVAALCIGPGHGPGDIIVARTPGGGHTHTPAHTTDTCSAHTHAHSRCGDDHHSHQHHDAEHGPCADIPLDQDEYRSGGTCTNSSKASGKHAPDTCVAYAHIAAACFMTQNISRLAVPRGGGWLATAPEQTLASIRSVILRL